MDHRVESIIVLLQKDLRKHLSINQLAKLVHLSPSRLNHIFRRETELSLSQYVKSMRLRRARDLLETTFLNVKETMASVGVNDASHFVRDFKKVFGFTPSEYRKRRFAAPADGHQISPQQERPTNGKFR